MHVHVVSFQWPWPANYGGVIDVLHKMRWLREQGADITLHAYIYDHARAELPPDAPCQRAIHYRRSRGVAHLLSPLPYIVSTRRHPQLLADLLTDNDPIIFEGLHTCHLLDHPALAHRTRVVRAHNVEHEYYAALARASRGWRRAYYLAEARKLKRYESKLAAATCIWAISRTEEQYLRQKFPNGDVRYLPPFTNVIEAEHLGDEGMVTKVLYHGNLGVEENRAVADYIQDRLSPQLPQVQFVLAGRNPRFRSRQPNVRVVANPTDEEMDELIHRARVNLLLTFQPTGAKIKLAHTLRRGAGHVLINAHMAAGTSLGELCHTCRDDLSDLPALITSKLAEPLPDLSARLQAMREQTPTLAQMMPQITLNPTLTV